MGLIMVEPQLPPPPITLTSIPTPPLPPPPKNPPEPLLTALFPEKTPYCAPDNPYRSSLPKETLEEHQCLLKEVLGGLRAPFNYDNEGPFTFSDEGVGVTLPS